MPALYRLFSDGLISQFCEVINYHKNRAWKEEATAVGVLCSVKSDIANCQNHNLKCFNLNTVWNK